MTLRRLFLGLALVAGCALAAVVLTRTPATAPDTMVVPAKACTSCDARMAGKRRLREFLKSKADEAE